MKKRIATSICASLILSMVAITGPALAQKTATPTTLKLGYYNYNMVKTSFPEAAGSDSLRNQAEAQLRAFQEDANKRLQKAQDDKKTKEDIEKMKNELQAEYNGRLQALSQLVSTQVQIANQNIAQALNLVMKDKGLDLVVDTSTIVAGGDKLVNAGVDVTDEVIKKLNPARGLSTGGGGATPPRSGAAGGAAPQ
jgi:Skp family chaperone for outer membrane proteins